MQKTKLLMISSVIALYLGGACISVAAELDENMQELAKNINILMSSTEKNELMNALGMMSKAVDDSMNIIPEKISPDDKLAVDEYRNGLRMLKKEIELAKEKILSGKQSDINDSVKRMNDIRVENHKKFR